MWVDGNYERAEQSFLKINTSGTRLDDWETQLIQHRNSSFARAVMSIANESSIEHYWPFSIEVKKEVLQSKQAELQEQVEHIRMSMAQINQRLFKPPKQTDLTRLTQPMMDIPERYKRPYWTGELLTIIQGYKGQEADTKQLLAEGSNAEPEQIIESGYQLAQNVTDVLDKLNGKSQKSLGIVPALYFYTLSGRYVRSLLYGFIYWMFAGAPEDVLQRQRLFCAYRDRFEKIIFDRKEDVATGITRRIGSGPEVTQQTANYYDGILNLLINHKGDMYTDEFRKDYADIVKKVTGTYPTPSKLFVAKSRLFTSSQKGTKVFEMLLKHTPTCGICEGILDVANPHEHDHIQPHSEGGTTSSNNQRIVHPFCNNPANRKIIEDVKSGQASIDLPYFGGESSPLLMQMNFFEIVKYSE